jgi:hypothetical protein
MNQGISVCLIPSRKLFALSSFRVITFASFDMLEAEEYLPIFLTCEEGIDALFQYFFKILNVRVSVRRL